MDAAFVDPCVRPDARYQIVSQNRTPRCPHQELEQLEFDARQVNIASGRRYTKTTCPAQRVEELADLARRNRARTRKINSFIEMHPQDMSALGVNAGDLVEVYR